MRVATWNVNSLRTRVARVVDWMVREDVDVLAMQEIKCKPEQFPYEAFEAAGYEVVLHGLNQWNGVAIAARLPIEDVEVGFPDMPGFLGYANAIYSEEGLWAGVQERFREHAHIHLHKGYLPGTLERDGFPDRIAYLHIDLNNADGEIAVLKHLFDRVVSGGIVIMDDYEWSGIYRPQKKAEDPWFAERNYRVFPLPTGQGLIIKR